MNQSEETSAPPMAAAEDTVQPNQAVNPTNHTNVHPFFNQPIRTRRSSASLSNDNLETKRARTITDEGTV